MAHLCSHPYVNVAIMRQISPPTNIASYLCPRECVEGGQGSAQQEDSEDPDSPSCQLIMSPLQKGLRAGATVARLPC